MLQKVIVRLSGAFLFYMPWWNYYYGIFVRLQKEVRFGQFAVCKPGHNTLLI
jgi:hypothetical protein